MSEKGICSRREADDFIARGQVFVNGERVTELGTKVSPESRVTLDPSAMREKKSLVTIIVNKPVGYVSAQPEKNYRPAVQLITAENQWIPEGSKNNDHNRLSDEMFRGLAVSGRLDIDSQGLLIFTQDGALAKKIIGENSNLEKEYLVRVRGQVSDADLEYLSTGKMIMDGKYLKPAVVEWLNEDQLRFILKEGKKRQVRRMCEEVGLQVMALKRVRVGQLKLGALPEGMWRFLKPGEKI
jgi:23S rRNA pseudouridine2604 synthase